MNDVSIRLTNAARDLLSRKKGFVYFSATIHSQPDVVRTGSDSNTDSPGSVFWEWESQIMLYRVPEVFQVHRERSPVRGDWVGIPGAR